MSESIIIDTPATIRQYNPGGKGGFGYSSTPLHRLVERRPSDDLTACGTSIRGKYAVTDGPPLPAQATKYGVCAKCWPKVAAAPPMVTYSVSVESEGYSADFNDILLVVGTNEEDAKLTAIRFIKDHHPMRQVGDAEAYPIDLTGDDGRVIGRLINTDEEG